MPKIYVHDFIYFITRLARELAALTGSSERVKLASWPTSLTRSQCAYAPLTEGSLETRRNDTVKPSN